MLPKILWKSLLVTPALLSATVFASSAIAADAQDTLETNEIQLTDLSTASEVDLASVEQLIEAETPVEVAEVPVAQTAPAAPGVASLEQISQYSSEGRTDSLSQVTSVSQLSDVQPTDWAFQALQSLVERYGCIAGYPDGTYRGNRPLTRYEFAAGLNACLDRVNELIAAGLADAVTQEDLAVLQRLQEEFAAELATLRGRVDALEARTAELEANQFSTTTKLNGEVIFNVADAFDSDDAFADQSTTFGYRVRLNLDTSFTGEDRLRTRFQARDIENFAADPLGFSYGGDNDGDFVLDDLFYTFPLGDRAQVLIGANSLGVDDFVASTISPLDSSGQGSLSNFGFPPQYYFDAGDAGAGAIIQLTDALSLDFGYTAGEASDPDEGAGLFNGNYSIIGQLTFLTERLDAALTYVNTYVGGADAFINGAGIPEVSNTYGAQINYRLTDGIEIGGGAAYTDTILIGTGDARTWSYQGTLAFPDLGGEGNLLGILAGVPPRLADLEIAGTRIPGAIEDASFLVEGFYRYRLNDNISITPGVIWITDPFNNNDLEDSIIGAVRTTFSF